jgi:hypothetical protein
MKTQNQYRAIDWVSVPVLFVVLGALLLTARRYLPPDGFLVAFAAFVSTVTVRFRVLERRLEELNTRHHKPEDGSAGG